MSDQSMTGFARHEGEASGALCVGTPSVQRKGLDRAAQAATGLDVLEPAACVRRFPAASDAVVICS